MRGDGTRHARDIGHAADDPHQAGEMAAVADPQLEGERRGVPVLLVDRHVVDVGLGAGDRGGDRRQHAGAVRDVDPDLGGEEPVGGALPAHRQPVLRMLAIVLDVDAVLAVDHHTAARRQEGEDRVVGYREAAARVGYEEPLGAGDREWRGAAGAVGGDSARQQPPRDERREALAEAELLVQLVEVLHAELPERGVPHFLRDVVERDREFPERLRQQLRAERDRLLASQPLQVMADGAAPLGGHDKVYPGRVRGRALGGDDLDRSEEHTSELQSRFDLVCRLLLEKKKSNYMLMVMVYICYLS